MLPDLAETEMRQSYCNALQILSEKRGHTVLVYCQTIFGFSSRLAMLSDRIISVIGRDLTVFWHLLAVKWAVQQWQRSQCYWQSVGCKIIKNMLAVRLAVHCHMHSHQGFVKHHSACILHNSALVVLLAVKPLAALLLHSSWEYLSGWVVLAGRYMWIIPSYGKLEIVAGFTNRVSWKIHKCKVFNILRFQMMIKLVLMNW